MLTASLVVVAFVAGLAGTWSPCGFSLVDTISAPRRRVGLCCAAFAVGACIGGSFTFVLLGTAGAALRGIGAAAPPLLAAVIAVAAALAEARAAPIAPQIRRQVPEHWRRVLPLPLAVGFYGVLLGLGFTTFVLTFALWALAALTVVVGSVHLGLALGLAFGIGRALPVVALAPVAQRPLGIRIMDAIAQRPLALAAVRRVEALALLAVAAGSIAVAPVGASTKLGPGTDPSVSGTTVVWMSPQGGVQRDEGGSTSVSVQPHPVVGGSMLAWRDGVTVHVVRLADMSEVLAVDVPGVDAVAVSDTWLVTRTRTRAGTDVLSARALATPDTVETIATARPPAQLGRPAIDTNVLVYHAASRTGSSIVAFNLTTSRSHVVRSSVSQLLTNPAILAGNLVYDRETDVAQLVEIGPLGGGGPDRVVYRIGAPAAHDEGHEHGYSPHTRTPHPATAKWTLWTTALSADRVYVTLLPRTGSAQGAQLVSFSR